jgi:hypothetical protein
MVLAGTNDPEIYNCEPSSSPTSPKSPKPLRKFTRWTKPRRQAARPRPGKAHCRPRWALFSRHRDLSLPLPLPPLPLTLLSAGLSDPQRSSPSAASEKLTGRRPSSMPPAEPALDAPCRARPWRPPQVLTSPRPTHRPQVPIARRGWHKNSRGCTGLFWPTEK